MVDSRPANLLCNESSASNSWPEFKGGCHGRPREIIGWINRSHVEIHHLGPISSWWIGRNSPWLEWDQPWSNSNATRDTGHLWFGGRNWWDPFPNEPPPIVAGGSLPSGSLFLYSCWLLVVGHDRKPITAAICHDGSDGSAMLLVAAAAVATAPAGNGAQALETTVATNGQQRGTCGLSGAEPGGCGDGLGEWWWLVSGWWWRMDNWWLMLVNG